MSIRRRLESAERRAGLAGGDCPLCWGTGGMIPAVRITNEVERAAALAARVPCAQCGRMPQLIFVCKPTQPMEGRPCTA